MLRNYSSFIFITGISDCGACNFFMLVLVVGFGQPFVKQFALCYQTVVCLVCPVLSVTLVYCGQTVGWIKMKTRHAGRPRPWPHCIRWRPNSPSPKEHSPQFSVHICCGQIVRWIKMPLGMEAGLGPGDFFKMGTQLPLAKKVGGAPSPIFGTCPLWPNGWIDQDNTWHGGGPWFGPYCARWGPSSPPQKGSGDPSPIFGPFLL